MAQSFDVNAPSNLPILVSAQLRAIEDQRRNSAYSAEQYKKVQEDTLERDGFQRSQAAKDETSSATYAARSPYHGIQRDDAVFEQNREKQYNSYQKYQQEFSRDAHEVPAGLAQYVAVIYENNRSLAKASTNPGGTIDLET